MNLEQLTQTSRRKSDCNRKNINAIERAQPFYQK